MSGSDLSGDKSGMRDRIYVCHTYYHALITFLKELEHREKGTQGGACLVLSSLSTDFSGFQERVLDSGIFREVVPFPEVRFTDMPELAELTRDRGFIVLNMIQRIRFTRRYGELEDRYIPDVLRAGRGRELYVFCDSDPVGTWLNQNHIRYHAVEDGLNCLSHFDTARYDNKGAFRLKAFMSKRLNLIFIQNGYGKYCMDMEVNNISAIALPPICGAVYREVPRLPLYERLTDEDRALIRDVFMPELDAETFSAGGQAVLLLTEAHRPSEMLIRMYSDVIAARPGSRIFIKPHPMDRTDYGAAFPDATVLPGRVPMEVLKLVPGVHFSEVITIYTDLTHIDFADRKTRLGSTFMDRYEDQSLHDLNDRLGVNTDHDDPL